MSSLYLRFAGLLWWSVLAAGAEPTRTPRLWDVERILDSKPAANFEKTSRKGNVQVVELTYTSEPYRGRPTRVFAYFAHPGSGQGSYPAMLLVHGGGGKAFSQWAELWAARGYAALAMDLAGAGPDGRRLSDGGPAQDDQTKFRELAPTELREAWTYHAVAAVLNGHAFLAGQSKIVDQHRMGITGISWGGYLTCIVAGIDHRLKCAVPVYGCGHLGEDSYWQAAGIFDRMPADFRRLWLESFDPSVYLPGVQCPILFVNGSNDFAYPLSSYKKSYELVNSPRTLCVTVRMPHGHEAGWEPKEIGAFVDSILKGGEPLARLSALSVDGGQATTTWQSPSPLTSAELNYTADAGPWKDRTWMSKPAAVNAAARTVRARIPDARPLVLFLTVRDARGLVVSTEHRELAR